MSSDQSGGTSAVRQATRNAAPRAGRRLELWWRRRLVRVLAGTLAALDRLRRRRARSTGTNDTAHLSDQTLPVRGRVLFLRPDRIGDMIVTTGVLRAIGAAPHVELDVLASPANASVLAHEPLVRSTLVLDRRDWRRMWRTVREMRARRYDVVVDCMPSAPSVTTLLLMLASGAPRRIGTAGRGIDHLFSPATASLPLAAHIVDHLALLAAPFHAPARDVPDTSPTLVLAEEELDAGEALWQTVAHGTDGVRLLVNISAGKAARLWPLESYATVIAAARDLEPTLQVAIMSAPHERARGESLAAMTGSVYVPTGTLRDAFAFVARADALFTPDTSLAHAAAALQVPTVDMLLAGKASQWGLYRAPGVNLESPDDTLHSLPVQHAADALRRVLREVRASRHFTPNCLRRNAIVRGQASRVAATLAASSASSRLVGRGSF